MFIFQALLFSFCQIFQAALRPEYLHWNRNLTLSLLLKFADCGREPDLRPKDAGFVAGEETKTKKVNISLIITVCLNTFLIT